MSKDQNEIILSDVTCHVGGLDVALEYTAAKIGQPYDETKKAEFLFKDGDYIYFSILLPEDQSMIVSMKLSAANPEVKK